MIKFLFILLGLYFMYYAGNIIYDLFFNKNSNLKAENPDDFYVLDFEELHETKVRTVGIEDVENLNTPKSFTKSELPFDTNQPEERHDVEHWRIRFESEQNIDQFDNKDIVPVQREDISDPDSEISDELINSEIINDKKAQEQQIEEADRELLKLNTNRWKMMLNLAETNVQVIKNIDGFKVYQSSAM